MLTAIITPLLWALAGIAGVVIVVLALIGAYFLIVANLYDR